MKSNTRIFVALTCGAAAMLAASTAPAAEPSLEEVVVTATKREQKLLDVSASVSAVTGERIRELGVTDVSSLARQIPGLQVQEYDLFPAFFIRGVGVVTETNDLNDQPVGNYIDEIYLGAPSLSRGQLFDVARLEVLRGPQGTLFGRNTSAGVIHYITQRPTDARDGYLQVGGGSFGAKVVEGAVGGPLSDRVRYRVSGRYSTDDGWQKDIFTGQRFAQADLTGLRAQLDFDATERLEIGLKLEYSEQDSTGARYGFSGLRNPTALGTACSPEQVNAQACAGTNGYRIDPLTPERVATDDPPLNDLESNAATLRAVYKGANFDFTSITGWRDLDRAWIADGDGTPQAFNNGAIRFRTVRSTDASQFSQEFRFSGATDAADWVVGAYYYKDNRKFVTGFPQVFAGNRTDSDLDTSSLAAFGQVDYRVADQWTLVGGLRWTDESREITQVLTPALNNPANTVRDNEKVDDNKVTGRAALEWRPREGLMAYLSYATGFKSGAFAQSLNAVRGVDAVAPEEATTAEIGLKSQFWNGRGQVTAALFDSNYKDFQATGSEVNPATGVQFNKLRNVGEMDAQGIEFESVLLPIERLQLSLAVTLMDTKISSTQNSGEADPQTGVVYLYNGNQAASAPKQRYTAAMRYMLPASESIGQFGLSANYNWQSKVFLSVNNNRYNTQESYGVLDITALWESPSKRFYGQAFVNNATDEEVAAWRFLIGFVGVRSTAWAMSPRSYGLRFGVNLD
ncbi:MAG: TonB-dependent receptor [Gammaproteobacteria bacterium]